MVESIPTKDVRFKIQEDLDRRVKESGKTYKEIIYEYFNGSQNNDNIPEWVFEPEKANRIILFNHFKSLELNDYNKKFVRYVYHRITQMLEKNPSDEKLKDLREFVIEDMTNIESPFELDLVREAMKPIMEVKDSIYSDNGLVGEKKAIESEIGYLNSKKDQMQSEISQLSAEINDLNAKKSELEQAIAEMQKQIEDIQAGIDERIKAVFEENESMKKTLEEYEKTRADLATALSTVSQLKDLILQRDAEIKKLKDSYNDIFTRYDTLINKMTKREFEKINARELKKSQ
ncbi:hypothetical protein [Thermoplasma volcanium GSS1]|uniref:Chromosome partition protein Smc n=1 Tax=Thermoplasma volcanium (strain ATCC 51530 / DSM 4299 / JCM 9571 / NBRC 15438 / GSS1) TaxID=273116 RepID=Q979Y5_THEVO|nr:coiled-coil protein [Thermoplasma volcanium]BAB60167.1 hypothetical protein [Thermoplasma volcanium GSS1]